MKKLVTVQVLYYMPMHPTLLNVFIHQIEDVPPELRLVKKFLSHWKNEIRATVREIGICIGESAQWRRAEMETLLD